MKLDLRKLIVTPLLSMGIGSIVPVGGNAPLVAVLTGRMNAASKVTIVARVDGTFDTNEYLRETNGSLRK